MAVTSGFFNSQNGDRKYSAEQMSALFDALITDGVFANIGTAFEVKILSGTSSDTITVGIGRCWFNSTWLYNDALLPIAIEPSEMILDRIDAVIIEINKNEDIRSGQIRMIKGVPSANPENPELVKSNNVYQYPLAYIYRSANSPTITQAAITNMIGTSACPYVTGILEVQTIDKIVAQWEAEFNTWFDQIKTVLDGDVAANLANKVLEIEAQLDMLAKERTLTRELESSKSLALQDNNGTALMGATVFATPMNTGGETITIQTQGASDVDEVFKVGDKFETMRTDLGDNWALCNGDYLVRDNYPELSEIIGYAPINDPVNKSLPTSGTSESITFYDIVYGNGYYVMLYAKGGVAKIYYTTDPINGEWKQSQTTISGSSVSQFIKFINGRFFVILIEDGGSFYRAALFSANNPAVFNRSCTIFQRDQYSTDGAPKPIGLEYSNGYYFIPFYDYKESTKAAIYYSSSYSTNTWSKVVFDFGGKGNSNTIIDSLSMVDNNIVIGYHINGTADALYFSVGTSDPRNSSYTEVHLSNSAFNGSQYGAEFHGVQKINGMYIAQGSCRVSQYDGDYYTFIATSKSLTSGWTIYPSQSADLGTQVTYNNGTYIIPDSTNKKIYYTNLFNPIISEETSWKPVTVSYTQDKVFLINNRYYILAYSSSRSTRLDINVLDTEKMKLPEISSDSFYTYIKVKGE